MAHCKCYKILALIICSARAGTVVLIWDVSPPLLGLVLCTSSAALTFRSSLLSNACHSEEMRAARRVTTGERRKDGGGLGNRWLCFLLRPNVGQCLSRARVCFSCPPRELPHTPCRDPFQLCPLVFPSSEFSSVATVSEGPLHQVPSQSGQSSLTRMPG